MFSTVIDVKLLFLWTDSFFRFIIIFFQDQINIILICCCEAPTAMEPIGRCLLGLLANLVLYFQEHNVPKKQKPEVAE